MSGRGNSAGGPWKGGPPRQPGGDRGRGGGGGNQGRGQGPPGGDGGRSPGQGNQGGRGSPQSGPNQGDRGPGGRTPRWGGDNARGRPQSGPGGQQQGHGGGGRQGAGRQHATSTPSSTLRPPQASNSHLNASDVENVENETQKRREQPGVRPTPNVPSKGTVAKSLSSPNGQTSVRELPLRPAYGSLGANVQLLANYVAVNPSRDLVFYRYHIDIERVHKTDAKPDAAKKEAVKSNPSTPVSSHLAAQFAEKMTLSPKSGKPSDPADPGAEPAGAAATAAGKKAAGMKRAHIIAHLLDTVDELKARHGSSALATDFRDNLITTSPLGISERAYSTSYRGVRSDYRAEDYQIVFKEPDQGPLHVRMSDLLNYLHATSLSEAPAVQEGLFSQILNIWLRHSSKANEVSEPSIQTVAGSKAYAVSRETPTELGAGIQAIRGYFSSIRFGAARVWVNVNVTHGSFFKPLPLGMWIVEAGLSDRRHRYELHTVLKGVRVRLTHRTADVNGTQKHIIKVIAGLATTQDGRDEKGNPKMDHLPGVPANGANCSQVRFWDKKKGRYVSVYSHFKTEYPGQNTQSSELVVNLGSPLNPAYYPVSVCHIVKGQNYRPKLSSDQTAAMITCAQLTPERSVQFITGPGFGVIGFQPPAETAKVLAPVLALAPANGRILQKPSVVYGNLSVDVDHKGSWNLRYVREYIGKGAPARWGVLPIGDISRYQTEWMTYFNGGFKNLMAKHGFAQADLPRHLPRLITHVPDAKPITSEFRDNLLKKLQDCRDQGYNLLFVLLPDKDSDRYNLVKAVSDVRVGIHTVCVARTKVQPTDKDPPTFNPQYWDNVLLKANLKRGGINHRLNFLTSAIVSEEWRAMVVGYDVTHSTPGAAAEEPSIIGMVASVDSQLAQWPATICFQPRENMEIVTDEDCFKRLLEPHLERYKKRSKNKTYPDVLIIYRDGVSEGQYDHVIQQEYPQIRAVCEKIYGAANQDLPKISIIVVGKRHHTRFYAPDPSRPNDSNSRTNPLPGTVVDRSITSQFLWEFYLQAHQAIKGTARPAHYVVVVDEFFGPTFSGGKNLGGMNGMKNAADVLESFTHALSYALGRCTRSIGVATPARLADKVCDRARCYTDAGLSTDQVVIANAVKDTMFYI